MGLGRILRTATKMTFVPTYFLASSASFQPDMPWLYEPTHTEVLTLSSSDPYPLTSEVVEQMIAHFENRDTETALCLGGSDLDYEIDRSWKTRIIKSTPRRVKYDPCKGEDVLGAAHNHPTGTCFLSPPDKKRLYKGEDPLKVVVCDVSHNSITLVIGYNRVPQRNQARLADD